MVAVDDLVRSHHNYPDSVHVVSQLAADGRANDHVQAVVAAAGVSVVVAAENGFHPCGGQRCDSGKEEECETLKRLLVQKALLL